jgi:hypothetical protein
LALVPEEIEKVAPELVAYDENHRLYSVLSQAVKAMLLNEFLKDRRAAGGEDKMLQDEQERLDDVMAK